MCIRDRGNTVVFLSSELEEFIGLCPKVIVFRNGTIFDIFEKDKINADTLLEGMFGQTAGVGETTISAKSNVSTLIKNKAKNKTEPEERKIVKIVNFDDESNNKNNNKIKVKTF